jgi:MarR family transcriptional regulator for hemolysin
MDAIHGDTHIPLGKYFAYFTKQYIGYFTNQLVDLPIDRYFYPLYLIGKYKGSMHQKELCALLHADKVTVNRIIEYLVKHKMIEKKVDAADRRRYNLHLKPSVSNYIERIEKAIVETDEFILGGAANKELFRENVIHLHKELQEQNFEDISLTFKRVKNK